MFSSLLARPHLGKLITTLVTTAQLLGWVTLAQASDAPPPVVPPPNDLIAIRRALREFDRFLDHHPLLEEELRLNPALSRDHEFLGKNPALRDFLAANPQILPGLRTYPRYLLYRALLRQANAPVGYGEIARLKDVFEQQPALENLLVKTPEAIRDPAFLAEHPVLRDFLTKHPALGRVFLPSGMPPGPHP